MAVYFHTSAAKGLLQKFNNAIDAGEITTWDRDGDGDYTHKAKNWAEKMWFRPSTSNTKLTFNVIPPKGEKVATTVYGYYHGHLIETFLNHFDQEFSSGEATALPDANDRCG